MKKISPAKTKYCNEILDFSKIFLYYLAKMSKKDDQTLQFDARFIQMCI